MRSRAHFAECTARNGPDAVQCAGALFTGMDAQELLALSRKELQAKAKLAGVRANAKSSFIVQELLKKSAVLKTPEAVLETPTPARGVLCDLTNAEAANAQGRKKKSRALLSGQKALLTMSVAEVAAWLRTTFAANASFAPVIDQYVAAFAENDIDGDTLSDLSKDDLLDAGIANAVHRTQITKKWAARVAAAVAN